MSTEEEKYWANEFSDCDLHAIADQGEKLLRAAQRQKVQELVKQIEIQRKAAKEK